MTTRKLLATLAALLLVCCGAGCSTCSVAQGPPVTMPKRDAAADVVVRAYLAAIAARDDEAVRLLPAPARYPSRHLTSTVGRRSMEGHRVRGGVRAAGAPVPGTIRAN
ncbi:hypothetical protein ACWEJ6_35830 [Nonomuraea sp. NPDC004702]